jgi:hypothetical protein
MKMKVSPPVRVSQPAPQERRRTELERADETARMKRALTGQQRPRTLHALIEQGPRLIPCRQCGQRPGTPCDGWAGYHLGRFTDARDRSLITAGEITSTVLGGVDIFTASTIIRDGGR